MAHLTLVLGGQRSGKSAYGESLIGDGEAVYIATCESLDDEMADRIARHRERRGDNWTSVEEHVNTVAALEANDHADRPQLIDSLGMWIANLLGAGYDVDKEVKILVQTLERLTSPVIIVSDETGLGVVPDNELARRFVDALGAANQALAAKADRVVLVTAGLPVTLKGKT
ncbi:MAG: bifunctional adenosylcobinamide kinase/adenosylcobinamide-phosphate guanylyltransferase [Alphaproteobacteria bacterium]